ncbi:MAG: 50S ribosomal protein L21 [Elusimicrobia bacterium]|nr:50S ribosomal protein L21 [Elusimicrobiota bacterium]
MFAVVETGGKQYWVSPGEILQVERLGVPEGKQVQLKAIWVSPDVRKGKGNVSKVMAEVLRHFRAAKELVFKKRPKKGYTKLQGHRQWLTEIRIQDFSTS